MHCRFRPLALLFLVLAVSCNDIAAPRPLSIGDANRSIDITIASLKVDIVFAGTSIGQNMVGDRCFRVVFDGQSSTAPGVCGAPSILSNLAPGSHSVSLQQQKAASGPPTPIVEYEEVAPAVTIQIVAGETAEVSFDVTPARARLIGTVSVNGQAPPNGQYQLCIDPFLCSMLPPSTDITNKTTAFVALVRPGPGTGGINGMMSGRLQSFTFVADVGQTVDVGLLAIEFASLRIDAQFDGTSLGQNVLGDRCFQVAIDGQSSPGLVACGFPATLNNLPPGEHLIALQQAKFTAGSPVPMFLEYENVAPPEPVTLVSGQTTDHTVDVTGVRAKLIGKVSVNGSAPPPGQYQLCIDGGTGCGMLPPSTGMTGKTTSFVALVRPGSGTGGINGMMTGRHASFAFDAAAGQTVDLGLIAIDFGSLRLDVRFGGVSLGQAILGDRCFRVVFDDLPVLAQTACGFPTILPNLPAGTHKVALQQQKQFAGTVPPMFPEYEDVAPPVVVILVTGQTTDQSFDVASTRAKIAGAVSVNGQAPPNGQYQLCIDLFLCSMLPPSTDITNKTTRFEALVRPGPGSGGIKGMMTGVLASFTFIAAAGQTTEVGGVSTAPGVTSIGADREVQPINVSQGSANATVNLVFSNVTGAGTTTVVQSSTGPAVPAGLTLGTPPVFFDLSTTATFDGLVRVCINYTGTTFTDPDDLKLLHGDASGAWTDVTTSHNKANRIICGSVTSFSPFVVAQGKATPVDVTPPVITPAIAGTVGSKGWYTSDVALSWSVSDAQSAVTSWSGCDPRSVTSDVAGVDYTCRATSVGGTTEQTVTIRRDATRPVISWTGARAYTIDQTVAITCSATDATSGIASSSCPGVTGPAYTLSLGTTPLSATAADRAGNQASASTSYSVSVTTASLCALVERWVGGPGVANSLCVKLEKGSYEAFRNELAAQTGKRVSTENAAILGRLVGAL